VEGAAITKYDGTFRCECGAVGWMRGACILAPRETGRPPSLTQRHILEKLVDGSRTGDELSDVVDHDDLLTVGELILALAAGWITNRLAGFGGVLHTAPTIYELTPDGRDVLAT
jgi:hypothetical protein